MVISSLKEKSWPTVITFVLILTSWIFVYWDILLSDSLLQRDDLDIITQIRNTPDVSSYFSKFVRGDYLDLQPVRDVSFFFNVFFERFFGYGGYHLTNIFLSFFILMITRRILKYFQVNEFVLNVITITLALHPSVNVITAWTSNRKHLLSVFFILLYYKDWLIGHTHTKKSVVYYILSVLSQPITVFFPVVLMFPHIVRSKMKSYDFILLLCTILILGINYYFYLTHPFFYSRNTFSASFFSFEWCLQLGRLFSQIFFPMVFAVEYNQGSIFSILGILAIGLLASWMYFKSKSRSLNLLILFLVISSFYPTLRLNIYRDAYGLLALLACLPFVLIELFQRSKKLGLLIISFLLPLYVYQSYTYVDMWESDEKLFFTSATKEGGAVNLINYAFGHRRNRPDWAYQTSVEIREQYPYVLSHLLNILVAESFFYTSLKTREEKVKIYLSHEGSGLFHHFFKYKFLLSQGYQKEAEQTASAFKKELALDPNAYKDFYLFVCSHYKDDCFRLGLNND